jgi:hypothetical protein
MKNIIVQQRSGSESFQAHLPGTQQVLPRSDGGLGRPRLDEQGRRFSYKRCKVCGFALRHFLDPVGLF